MSGEQRKCYICAVEEKEDMHGWSNISLIDINSCSLPVCIPCGRKVWCFINDLRADKEELRRFREHREEAFITCQDDCWCWDVEAKIAQEEAQR